MTPKQKISNQTASFHSELQQVVSGGYCIGCGACNSANPANLPIILNHYGMYQLDTANINVLDDITAETTARICPFSNHGPNEDDIGNKYYGAANQHDSRIGYYSGLYVGHAEEEEFRARGSSGGMLTWILTELIRTGKVDAVVHVKKADNPHDGILFRYAVSKTPDEVQAGAKSRYYPVEASQVIAYIK